MHVGDIVFFPASGKYIKYVIKKIIDDDLLVIIYKSKQFNWLSLSDVIGLNDFLKIYKNEEIYE